MIYTPLCIKSQLIQRAPPHWKEPGLSEWKSRRHSILAMKALLLRTGSVPVLHGSPKVSLSVHDSVAGFFSGEKRGVGSPKFSMHLEINRRKDNVSARSIRRALSESDVMRSGSDGVRSFPSRIPEEDCFSDDDVDDGRPLILNRRGYDRLNYARAWPGSGVSVEELGFPGGGIGKGKNPGGGGEVMIGDEDRSKIGAYYEEMLKSNPGDSLLLRNYGKFLHEVEKDAVKAEEYYGRAILASPGDGEVLSLYGKLIWETDRDENRAKSYFDQAVHASPNDCMVLGSYARFMWEAEEDEDEEEMKREVDIPSAMVAAF